MEFGKSNEISVGNMERNKKGCAHSGSRTYTLSKKISHKFKEIKLALKPKLQQIININNEN